MAKLETCGECGRIKGRVDDDLLIKIFNHSFTHDDLSKIFGVSRVAITNRIKKLALEKTDITPEDFKRDKLDHLYNLAYYAYKSMTPSEIQKASLNQKVVLFGTIFDKIDKMENRGTPEVSFVGVKHIHELGPEFTKAIEEAMSHRNKKRIENRRKAIENQMGESNEETN